VPFNIPTSWFFMLYASLAICGRVLRARDDGRTKLVWAVVAGFVLTAWDVSMDPAMVRTAHWMWHLAPAAEQTTLQRIFVSDIFYGMPLSNWLGWLLTGTVVARVMLAFAPPTLWARARRADALPARALRGERRAAHRHLLQVRDVVGGVARAAGHGAPARPGDRQGAPAEASIDRSAARRAAAAA
jgi:uncharacterized membrane protein